MTDELIVYSTTLFAQSKHFRVPLIDLTINECHLDSGRFYKFRKIECSYTVPIMIDRSSSQRVVDFFTDKVELIKDKPWDVEILSHHVNKIEIRFKFHYDEDAVIFKLLSTQ